MRNVKKWLSVMLAAALVAGSLQAPVYASENAASAETAAETEFAEEAEETKASETEADAEGSQTDADEAADAGTEIDDSAQQGDEDRSDPQETPDDTEETPDATEEVSDDTEEASNESDEVTDGTDESENDTSETEEDETTEDSAAYSTSETAAAGSTLSTETAAETEPADGTTVADPVQKDAKNADAATEGTIGDNLTWKIDDDGVLTISGTGELKYTSETSYNEPWKASGSTITKIVVGEGITSLPDGAFDSCSKATEVILPSTLISIGSSAFSYMSSIKTLELPDGLTKIGSYAFSCMNGLEQITIPDSVTSLSISAFKYCNNLKSVTLGTGVKTISESLFEGDRSLTEVNITGTVKTIGSRAFYGCKALESFEIPDSVNTIYGSAFYGCIALKAITIPGSVKTLGTDVFNGCTSLTNVTVSEGCKEIPENTFRGCTSLAEVSLPDSVTKIGNRAFYECGSLTEITLPAGLEYLGDEAFLGCASLSKVTLPEEAFEQGQNIFTGCSDDLQYFDREGNLLSDTSVGETNPAETDNNGAQNYTRYGEVINSYLVDEGEQRLRVEYYNGALTREYFDASGNFVSRSIIPLELPIFGGFMAGSDGYYVVFGQTNSEMDDEKEVIRVVRYSKDWKRIGAASICGENTTVPFDAGSASITESGGILYIRTCHEMYSGHQANLTVAIRESDMTMTWIYSTVSNVNAGYVSHSFNQIIKVDGDDIIAADHGDAYPRGFVLFRYAGKAGAESLGRPENVIIMSFGGETGNNSTGASLGELEISDTHYILTGNSVDQGASDYKTNAVRNIFVTATSKDNFTSDGTSTYWVTSYTGSEEVSTPLMTALPDGRYLLMWTVDDVLNYCFVGSDGVPEGTIYTGSGSISDCHPYYKDNCVWWYVTKSTAPIYYYISLSDPGEVHVENAGHKVTLDPMGGTVSGSLEMDVEHGSTYGELPTPTREAGYKFLGWFTGPKYGTQITSDSSVRVRGDETLYAHWQHCWSYSEDSGKLELHSNGSFKSEWTSFKSNVKTIVIDDTVTYLSYSQFYYYNTVKTVVMPNSVTEISSYAFYQVPVETVYFLGTEAEWNAISIANGNDTLTSANIVLVSDPASLSYAQVSGFADTNYTGSEIEPAVTVTMLGDILTANSDYTVSYSDNKNAGTATITVTGCGNYHGSVSGTFTIKPISISSATVTGLTDMAYTGSAIEPSPVVAVNGNTLTEGTDYTLTYSNNTNVGTAKVTITGSGNCTGTITKSFKITQAPITDAEITGLADKTYTGAAQTQTPVVKLGSRTLTSGTDYTVTYSDNTNAGTATVTFTGKGNYTGTATATFEIAKASITEATVTGIVDKTYTGASLEQDPVVKLGSVTLTVNKDYTVSYSNNTAVGTAAVKITGCGNYTGLVERTFEIKRISMDDVTVAEIADQTYTGAEIKPELSVKLGSDAMSQDTDYEVIYSDNIAVGTASVTITGKGNYEGTVTREFKILPIPITSSEITGLTNCAYTGAEQTPVQSVKLGSDTLDPDTDYTVSYSGNVNAGTATVTITGKGNYTGTVTGTFEIEPVPMGADAGVPAVITGITDASYTGSAQKPVPTVALGELTLVSGTDYTVSYTDNVNIGTATVTVTGCGNYTGTVTQNFEILPIDITDAVVAAIADRPYTGKAIEPVPAVTLGDATLNPSTDFTVVYSNNVEVGEAGMTITGQNNCSGTVTATFRIVKAAQPLKVTSTATSVAAGTKITLKATGNTGKVTYSSSDASVANVSTTGVVTTLKAGKAVITVNAAGTANYNAASEKITVTVLPAVTASLKAANQVTGIKLTWKQVPGATGYIVYRGSAKVATIKSGKTVTYTDKKANTNGSKYTFKVIATASTGNSKAKALTTYRVARPAISSVKNTASKKMTVKWKKSAKATGYQIQYSTSSKFKSAKSVTVTKKTVVSKVISKLTKGKKYYVRIRTYKKVGKTNYYSLWSKTKTVKIKK